ncbi:AAA family ATPase [Candidatus Uhrbacteria bacterium]|nr:AAA family ATPase [Candidatus Uhrbacteria bacterium]
MSPPTPTAFTQTPDLTRAFEAMEKGGPFVFITGRAGTGKSTLLRRFRLETTRKCVFLAPTGVAALNIEGQTIHLFFGFSPGITVTGARKKARMMRAEPIYKKIDTLVIDELSMVRADLMDCMDAFLRAARGVKEPFGGVRIVGIGDLFQLPPVVTAQERGDFARAYPSPFFFGSNSFKQRYDLGEVELIELTEVFRQRDQQFIEILNAIRERTATSGHFAILNNQVRDRVEEGAIVLTGTNVAAHAINDARLAALKTPTFTIHGTTKGSFKERDMPTSPSLLLKVKARVMFVANDQLGQYVNGTVGTVELAQRSGIIVRTDEGKTVHVTAHTWTLYRSTYDQEAGTLGQEKLGSFTQLPLRLAWAVTIHKSQGKTFDRVHIDLRGGAFASGQTYVALSRVRSLPGLTLAAPIGKGHIILDQSVVQFLEEMKVKKGKRQGLGI